MMNIKSFQKSAEGCNFFLKFIENGINPYAEIVQKSPILVCLRSLSKIFVALVLFLPKYEKRGSSTRFTLRPGRWQKKSPLEFFSTIFKGGDVVLDLGEEGGVCKLDVSKSIRFG